MLEASLIGRYMADKYRRAAEERGHYAVAMQLRKQGVPLGVAQLILFGLPTLSRLGYREQIPGSNVWVKP